MNKMFFRKATAFFMAVLMVFCTLTAVDFSKVQAATSDLTITESAGWFESAYIEWNKLSDATAYNVYVKKSSASSYGAAIDNELVRQYPDYWRADAVGLAAGTYDMKVVATLKNGSKVEKEVTGLEVAAYDRSGFAWVDGTSSGAYNEDGTLKSDAVVLYITEETKDTVSMDVVTSSKGATTNAVGLQNILNLYKKTYETRPLDIRIIGKITDPATLEGGDLVVSGSGADKRITAGITIEGIGEDATIFGFGIRIKNCSNVEVRNLGIMAVDSSEGDCLGLQQDNDHIWVHNIDFFYGMAGGDSDQAKGDGSLDCKDSTYVTFSYNHFWDSGKCNLLGLSEGTTEGLYITYHHNWYDHSDSRHPRARFFTVHTYNNYFDGCAKYGIGSASNSNIFAESNYFRNVQYPIMTSLQATDIYAGGTVADAANNGTFSGEYGGVVKAYGNIMVGKYTFVPYGCTTYVKKGTETAFDLEGADSTKDFDAYVVNNRTDVVPSSVKNNTGVVTTGKNGSAGLSYNNFDTAASMYSYTADTAEDVPAIVTANAGRMNGGDFTYSFDDKTYTQNKVTVSADEYYGVDTELKSLVVNYETTLVSVGGDANYDPTALKSISLDKTSASLLVNGTVQLTVSYNPSNTTSDKTVTWSSSDSTVATVADGLVTAKKLGTATITADCNGITAECAITVSEPVAMTGIALNKTTTTITAGGNETLTVSALPTNTTDTLGTVTWSSDNTAVATVSNGKVTAVAEGTAVITATANGFSATCTVTVEKAAEVVIPEGTQIYTYDCGNTYFTVNSEKKDMQLTVPEDGNTYYGSKLASGHYIKFTTAGEADVVMYVYGSGAGKKFTLDSTEYTVDAALTKFTQTVGAGEHTLQRSSGESWLYYLSVTPKAGGSETPAEHTHTYDEGVVTTPATCISTGIKTYTCTSCEAGTEGHTKSEVIPATGVHNYSTEWTIDVPATTESEGSKSHHCTTAGCSAKTDVTPIPKLTTEEHVHTYDAGVVTKAATCIGTGIKTYTCTSCEAGTEGHTKTEVIPATGEHKYSTEWTVDVEATKEAAGIKSHHCTTAGCSATADETYIDGWFKFDGVWYYYNTDGNLATLWTEIDGKKYYFTLDGQMVTGWKQINNKWYFFNGAGQMVTGWKLIAEKWYYFDTEGVMLTGWQSIGGKWYYFNAKGAMATEWCKVGDKWYYFDANGVMLTGWQSIGGKWYYFNAKGAMATGWTEISSKWYYFDEDGMMLTGWQEIGGSWYYFNAKGAMLTGWQEINSKWYYFNKSGKMVTGWNEIGGKWYYMNKSGAMVTGWNEIGGKWYYMDSKGAVVTGWYTIGTKEYYFDSNGVWIEGATK